MDRRFVHNNTSVLLTYGLFVVCVIHAETREVIFHVIFS